MVYYNILLNKPWHVEVFTLSSGVWNALPCSNMPRGSIKLISSQVVIDRFIYWVASKTIVMDDDFRKKKLIMSFDLISKEFRVVDIPDRLESGNPLFSISKLMESLVLFVCGEEVCDVQKMEHDGCFTKLFVINTPDNLIRNILGFRKNGELVMETEKDFEIGSENGSALEVYESCSKRIKNLGIYGKEGSFFMSSYKETLLLLDHSDSYVVCVTGAGGYVASWVVKLLLSKGYTVHGTVRDPYDEEKNGHLKKLENAEESLHLCKADLLNYEGLCDAFSGCNGVLHVASPVPGRHVSNPQLELLDPAILGTQNVLNACLKAKVEKSLDQWYAVSKILAEIETLEFAKRDDLTVVTICPSIVIGPMLQPTVNATSLLLLSYLKEEGRSGGVTMENIERPYVDVRDFFSEKSGRALLNSKKLLSLGWNYRPVDETIVDTVKNYEEAGFLDKGKPFP
nr:cinnamoyl-CoA reductase 2-like [Tanacetum cinerariifolium]